ncbi:RNA polymerase sigma-70 factor (ECF subfamily) [Sphingobium xanthum]|jgi:RNA polymerase sigma factor (sigma-70 family)|uniref:sigma-70 family RNA polymerase sigma factor n=1 Tax=Sphingobium xanthum TaxID=1387165 RepID=UPI001C8B6E0F|nr:sigma-70 family RNA polymerase sigma factor [Sphingobium xanthum]
MTTGDLITQADERRARLTAALDAVARGDRAALRDVYDLTSAKLFGVCLRICQDREVAADIVQETYLKVWQRAGRFDPAKASPITWLCAIARNGAIDWRRTHRPATTGIEAADNVVDDSASAPERIEEEQSQARIVHCLDALGGSPAEAIRAAFFNGFTYAQLAERMKVPLGTMKSWIRRGLAQLKECLADG